MILTERGHFGLLQHGAAEEDAARKLVGDAQHLSLLREVGDEEEKWYEFVDTVSMYHLRGEFRTLEEVDPSAKVERIQVR